MSTRIHYLLLPLLFLFFACNDYRHEKAIELLEQGKALEENQLPDSAVIVYQ